jgi:hypothetical protein
MNDPTITVAFRLSCPVPADSSFAYGYHWRDEPKALEHRLATANHAHGFDLDIARCVLSRKRITMVGTAEFENLRNTGKTVGSLTHYLGWILKTVYGHTDIDLHNFDVKGLSISVREIAREDS